MNGFLGALIEAWAEFRVNRARVVLSLVGVGIAVLALTAVVGVGQIATQAQVEQMERSSGRPATLYLSSPYDPKTGQSADPARLATVFEEVVDRYSITYSGAMAYQQLNIQLPNGTQYADARTVDADYGVMHRMQLLEGSWFTERDADRLMPAVILNRWAWEQLGSPPIEAHPTVTVYGERPTEAAIIGVTASSPFETYPQLFILNSAWDELHVPVPEWGSNPPQYELWVPPELADELTQRIRGDVAAAFGEGWEVQLNRNDYLAWSDSDPLGPLRLALLGVSALILLLGALGLVNISLVTVRQRIREIGIRRAFGATSARVFLAVMLESVVATAFAGSIGIILAIILVRNDFVLQYIGAGLSDVPPFPAKAALIGFLAATGVGALAGLLPALVAVRVKVIDAIRY